MRKKITGQFSLFVVVILAMSISRSIILQWMNKHYLKMRQLGNMGKGKVCIRALWPIRPELIPVSVTLSD